MGHLSLLGGARDATASDWEAQAAAVLRRSGRLGPDEPDSAVWSLLATTTLDGVMVPPLGTAGNAAGCLDAGLPGRAPYTRGTRAAPAEGGWDIRARHIGPSAAASAEAVLSDLENGVTSLWLVLGAGGIAVTDLATAVEPVLFDLAPVVVDCPEDPLAAAEALSAVLRDRGGRAASGTSLGGDPVSAVARGVTDPDEVEVAHVVGRLADLATDAGVLALTVDATAVHDLGASDAQELGYAVAAGTAYLRLLTAAGLPVERAASLLEFRYAATDEQFPTIAKLRAARRLWTRVTELSGVAAEGRGQVQHAVTSAPMMTRYDPWVNLLRTTVAAFAAGVGGATSVTVLPYDHALGLPDELARRLARNTSSLLVHEAHVGRVSDPAGGAYAVERLTHDLAHAAWEELQRIEQSGGVLAALADGSLADRVGSVADARGAEIARRRRRITGVSEFPHLGEELPERPPHPAGAPSARPYAAAYELLRDQPAATPVFLATMGTVAAHTARASFAVNLLAAGGVDTVAAGATHDLGDVLAAYGGQPVVFLAGSDEAYAAWGGPLVEALREAGATWVGLAGTPPAGLVVDDAFAGGDAVAFLRRVRDALGVVPGSPSRGGREEAP